MNKIQFGYQTRNSTLYSVSIRPDDGRIYVVPTQIYEAPNATHWGNYVTPMTEMFAGNGGLGYYEAAYPIANPDVLTTELIFEQQNDAPDPTIDKLLAVGQSQGSNIFSLGGLVSSATALSVSAGTMVVGTVAAGSQTVTQMVTTLNSGVAGQYNGRVVIWTSGALKGVAATITLYDPSSRIVQYTSVPIAPSQGDAFIIV